MRPGSLSHGRLAVPCVLEVIGCTAAPRSADLASPGGPWTEDRRPSALEAMALARRVAAARPPKRRAARTKRSPPRACPDGAVPCPPDEEIRAALGFPGLEDDSPWPVRAHLWRMSLEAWATSSTGGGLLLFTQRGPPPASLRLARTQDAALPA